MTRTPIYSIDLAKFIGAVYIVALHCRLFYNLGSADYYLTCFCRIAVPFFFIASSYFFFKGQKSIWEYVKRLLILYLCWFIIELPITIQRFFIDSDEGLYKNIFLFLRGLFINSTFFASWFITALWQGMLIVWWLSKKVSNKVLALIGSICFLIACVWSMYREVFIPTPIWPAFKLFGVLLAPSNSFIIAIPYCILGKYFADNPEVSIKRPPIVLIFLALIAALEVYLCRNIGYMSDSYLSLILLCPCVFISVLHWNVKISPESSKYMRHCSILIYILHLPIRYLLIRYLSLPDYGAITFLIVLSCSALSAMIIVWLSQKYPILRFLY